MIFSHFHFREALRDSIVIGFIESVKNEGNVIHENIPIQLAERLRKELPKRGNQRLTRKSERDEKPNFFQVGEVGQSKKGICVPRESTSKDDVVILR
jgi:hypothetical protein